MFCFLKTDIRVQKLFEKRIQTSVDSTVNYLRYEIKFEIRVKDKITSFQNIFETLLFFFKQEYILFLET